MDFSKIIVPKVKTKFDVSKITLGSPITPTITLPTSSAKATGTVGLGTFFKNELNTQLNRKAEELGVFPVPEVDTQTIWNKVKSVFKPPILNQRFMDALKRQTQMEGNQTPSDFDVFKTGLVNIAGIEAILLATGQIIANIANTIKTTNYLTSDLKNSTNILKQYSEETLNPNNLTDIYREGIRSVRPDLFVSSSLKPDMEAMTKLNDAYRYLESYASDMKITGSFVSELFKTKLYLLTGIQLPIPETNEVVNSVNNLIAVKNPYALSLYGNSPITVGQLMNPNPQALQNTALVNTLKNWAGYKLPTTEQLDFFKKMNVVPEVKPTITPPTPEPTPELKPEVNIENKFIDFIKERGIQGNRILGRQAYIFGKENNISIPRINTLVEKLQHQKIIKTTIDPTGEALIELVKPEVKPPAKVQPPIAQITKDAMIEANKKYDNLQQQIDIEEDKIQKNGGDFINNPSEKLIQLNNERDKNGNIIGTYFYEGLSKIVKEELNQLPETSFSTKEGILSLYGVSKNLDTNLYFMSDKVKDIMGNEKTSEDLIKNLTQKITQMIVEKEYPGVDFDAIMNPNISGLGKQVIKSILTQALNKAVALNKIIMSFLTQSVKEQLALSAKVQPPVAQIPKELEPLAIEARKYKSAEEFADSQLQKIGEMPTTKTAQREWFQKRVELEKFYNQAIKPVSQPVAKVTPQVTPPVVPTPQVETKPITIKEKPTGVGMGGVNPIEKVVKALKEAKPLRKEQEKIYTQERTKRIAKAKEAGKIGGEAGYYAELKQLEGEMLKVQFESIRSKVTQEDIDALFNLINDSSLLPFQQITAKAGLLKLLGEYGGVVPTEGELKLLNKVFGQEFTKTVSEMRPLLDKIKNVGYELINTPRALMASFDFSMSGRQAIFLIGSPKEYWTAVGSQFKYFAGEKFINASTKEISNRPTFDLMQGRLALTDVNGVLTDREEAFMASLPEKIPVIGIGVRASDRAYSGGLNRLRADKFDSMYYAAEKLGRDPHNDPKLLNDIASFVNSATGRGDLTGALKTAQPLINGLLFSPRLMASRINLLNPIYYAKLDPFVRKEALRSLLTFLGFGAGILISLKLAFKDKVKVGLDWRSADVGKVKTGNTRLDFWGGFQQYFRLVGQLVSGQYVSTTTGVPMTLGEGYKPLTRFDIILRFFEYKEAPFASLISDLLKGQTAIGEPFSWKKEIIDRLTPMVFQDFIDLAKDNPDLLPLGIFGIFGVGLQTYSLTYTKSEEAGVKQLRDKGTSEEEIKRLVVEARITKQIKTQIGFVKNDADLTDKEKLNKINKLTDLYNTLIKSLKGK